MPTPQEIQSGVPKGSVLPPYPAQFVYKWCPRNLRDLPSPLCWWHVSIYHRSQRMSRSQNDATRHHFIGVVVWEIEQKINDGNTQGIYFSHRCRLVETRLIARGWEIQFRIKYKIPGCKFRAKNHKETAHINDHRKGLQNVCVYSLFKSEWLSTNI
jgi:hypothetical protein